MDDLKIRKIKAQDLKVLSKIYDEVYKKFDVGERWTKNAVYKMLHYWFEKHPDLAYLAEYRGRIVGGMLVGVKPWWDGAHLIDGEIFVHPDYQKKRIGTELMKFIFKLAIKRYKVVSWDTFTPRGKYPLRWYKSVGFREIEE